MLSVENCAHVSVCTAHVLTWAAGIVTINLYLYFDDNRLSRCQAACMVAAGA